MKHPRRALILAGALVLASCEPAAFDSAPAQVGLGGDSVESVDAQSSDKAGTESALVASGLHHLVAMTGPANDDGTLGSGCADEEAETLPDGDWYAFVVDNDQARVTVDVACVYGTDTDQFEVYAEAEGAETAQTPLVNHVVANDVVHERTLRIATEAEAYLASSQWEPISASGFAQAAQAPEDGEPRGVWLRVESGMVTAVVQPYVAGAA